MDLYLERSFSLPSCSTQLVIFHTDFDSYTLPGAFIVVSRLRVARALYDLGLQYALSVLTRDLWPLVAVAGLSLLFVFPFLAFFYHLA